MPLASVEAEDAPSLEEGSKSPSKSAKFQYASTRARIIPPENRKRGPSLGALGYLLAAVRKLLHVSIHCRGTWQLTLTASLALYYFQSEVLLDDLRESANLPGAARECTKACGVVCALPGSAFVPTMDTGVVYRDVSPPPSNRKRFARDGAVDVPSIRLKTHPSETWWINPQSQTTYCQWSWTQSLSDDPLARPNLQYMADKYLGTPHQRRWIDYPGKYYNTSWDEVQNWLSLEHDPILLLHLRYRQMLYLGGQSIRGYALIAILAVVYTLLRVRHARYGSLYYLLQLDSLMAVGARSAVRVRWVAFISLCMPASVAVTLFYSHASTMLYVKLVVTYSILGMSFYSLINQASPVGPSLRLNAKRNEPTALPCMRWWHTSELTVSQVFAIFLLSERRLEQVKSQNKYALLQRHINTAMLEAIPLEELLRIKAIWQVDEELAKHNKTRKMTSRKMTAKGATMKVPNLTIKASSEGLGDSMALTGMAEDSTDGLLDTMGGTSMASMGSTGMGGTGRVSSSTGGSGMGGSSLGGSTNGRTGSSQGSPTRRASSGPPKKRVKPIHRRTIKEAGESDSDDSEAEDSVGSLQGDSEFEGDDVMGFVDMGGSSSPTDLEAGGKLGGLKSQKSGSPTSPRKPQSPRNPSSPRSPGSPRTRIVGGRRISDGSRRASESRRASSSERMPSEGWRMEDYNDSTSSSPPLAPTHSPAVNVPTLNLAPQPRPQSPPTVQTSGVPSTTGGQVSTATAKAPEEPPPRPPKHVHSCREWIFVLGNTVMGMSQYWILTASMVLTCNKLLTLLIKYSVGVAFVTKCTCSCDTSQETIQQCYEKELAKERSAWLHLLWPMTIPLLVVIACLVCKLHFDLQRLSGTRYGTLQYVIQCELRKRSRANRVLAVVTTICTSCITAALLVMTYHQARKYKQEAQLYAFLIDVMQQLVAGFTMCTETGYLTPLAQRDVPEIVLPFRWWDSGQNVLSQLMCLAALSNDEIGRLKEANAARVRSHGLPRRFVAYLSVYDMLRIKHHLRRQDVMNPFRLSVEESVLPAIQGVAAMFNKTVAFGRVTNNSLRIAPAPEADQDNFMMTDFLEEEETTPDQELFCLSQTFALSSQAKSQAIV